VSDHSGTCVGIVPGTCGTFLLCFLLCFDVVSCEALGLLEELGNVLRRWVAFAALRPAHGLEGLLRDPVDVVAGEE
jgi:hypothetical protein